MPKLPLVLGLALLGAPAPALAQTSGGYASAPAVIERVACREDCVDARTARVGSVVRIVGSDHTGSFIYLLRRGERLLRSADPVTTLHGWLPAEPELR